jgi:hypothetical protein
MHDQGFILAAAIQIGAVEEVESQIQRPVNGGNGFLILMHAVKFRHPHAVEAER